MRWFSDHYLQGGCPARLPVISPSKRPTCPAFRPAIVVTAEFDPLRDEGNAYAAGLRDAGVAVHHIENPGVMHAFLWLGGVIDRSSEVYRLIGAQIGALPAESHSS